MPTLTYEHDVTRVLRSLNFDSDAPSVLYSGYKNRTRAEAYARKHDLKLISDTEGGRYLENPDRYHLHGPGKARPLWATGSGKFVSTIKGDVVAFVVGAESKGIFREREIGILIYNEAVEKVNGISRQKLFKQYTTTYAEAMDHGIPHRDACKKASTAVYRSIATAELSIARENAYASGDKKAYADYRERRGVYFRQIAAENAPSATTAVPKIKEAIASAPDLLPLP